MPDMNLFPKFQSSAPLQAGLYYSRKNRLRRIAANSNPPVTFGATAYTALGGEGRRDYLIAVSSNANINNGPLSNLVNGVIATGNTNGVFFNDHETAAEFTFTFPYQCRVDEFTWYQDQAETQGTWKFSGSNDGTTFTDLATGFDLGGANATDVHAFTNTAGYSIYKLTQTGGTTNTDRWMEEINFKISLPSNDSTQAAAGATAYTNQDGEGDRTARMLVLLSSAGSPVQTACNESTDLGNLKGLVNGVTGTQDCADAVAFHSAGSSQIDFAFRQPLVIDEFTWLQQSVADMGTWTLSASADNGATFTTLATGIEIGLATTDVHAFANTKGYRNYRLTQTAGTLSSAPWVYEVNFKTSVLKAS
jgi:hypothetical protein